LHPLKSTFLADFILQIISEFPATLIRRITPNSHNQFCESRQTDKATILLATNTKDPAIRKLIVRLLNELQPEVDECHASEEGIKLKREFEEKLRVLEISRHQRMKDRQDARLIANTTKEATKDVPKLESTLLDVTPDSNNKRRQPRVDYNENNTYAQTPCDYCYTPVSIYSGAVCWDYNYWGHFSCFEQDPVCTPYLCVQYITDRESAGIEVMYDEAGIVGDTDGDVDGEEESTDERESSSREYEEESELEGEDEGVPTYRKSAFARDQERENRAVQRDEVIVLKEDELQDFISEKQPDDDTRHRLTLLQLPVGKT
jgi:hypothetical protein